VTVKRAKQPARGSSAAARSVRRAIAKANPTKDRPTVGKPVIVDPVQPQRRKSGERDSKDKKE
jgi:hypothetical protein